MAILLRLKQRLLKRFTLKYHSFTLRIKCFLLSKNWVTHCLWLVFAYLLLLAIKANAATLLKAGMADPDALVAGDYIYFAGTGGRMDTIDFLHEFIVKIEINKFMIELL
jgi:hypothetical protein